jgi:hypothetical protein
MAKKNENRKSIPETVKLQLWVKSAGRCEFKGCNTPVWYNGLTLSESNFGEFAHIIAASEEGPRGESNSEELQIDFSNLMLLCAKCHKEIDDFPKRYPAELLKQWKSDHEYRIEVQTNYPEEIHKSTILTFNVNIGDRNVPINFEALRNAMFPKYPSDSKGIRIERTDFNRMENDSYWNATATDIKRKIEKELSLGVSENLIKHLSIFAIAPMPLLMFLGKCVGDTIPSDIYQSHRNIVDTSQTWSWIKNDSTKPDYIVKETKVIESDNIILKIALSDTINPDKYSSFVDDSFSIYEITIDEPSPHFIKNKTQLENFSYEYRKILNKIQAKHGRNCNIFILPAMPISYAVECGRVILPTKDPNIFVCEYYTDFGFKKVLKIN